MEELWRRIERWLEQEAPDVLADLNAGATEAEIFSLEEELGIRFPADLRESFKLHNGQKGDSAWLFAGWEFLSLERIQSEWKVWKDLYDSGTFDGSKADVQPGIRNEWWNPMWIPLTYDGSGNHHCIDLSPADEGTHGQIIIMWHDMEERRILASSYKEWLESIADKIETAGYEEIFESGEFEF